MMKLFLVIALHWIAPDSSNVLSLKIVAVKNNLTVVYEISNNSNDETAVNLWNYGVNGFIGVDFYEVNGDEIEMPCTKVRPDLPSIFRNKRINVTLKSGEKRVFKIKMVGCDITGCFKRNNPYKAQLVYNLHALDLMEDPILIKGKYYSKVAYSEYYTFKFK